MSEKSGFGLLFTLLLVGLTISSFTLLVTSAMTEYAVMKPLITTITPQPSNIKLVSLKFDYDTLTSTYKNVSVAVRNEGPSTTSINVAVHLYNVSNTIIAQGQTTTPTIKAGTTFHTSLSLSWENDKTVNDFATAKVTLS